MAKLTRLEVAAKARAAKIAKYEARVKSGKKSPPKQKAVGVIRDDESYPVEGLNVLFGIGPSTLRKAERSGLRIAKLGARKYVNGRDLREFLFSHAAE